jgi:hypothetical protein
MHHPIPQGAREELSANNHRERTDITFVLMIGCYKHYTLHNTSRRFYDNRKHALQAVRVKPSKTKELTYLQLAKHTFGGRRPLGWH